MKTCPRCKGTGEIAPKLKRVAPALPFGKPASIKRGKRAKAAAHRINTSEIRTAVMVRSDGVCESCLALACGLSLDHWLGGAGRRRQMQSVENTWALCAICDSLRTANRPDAAFWNRAFQAHCDRHGLPFVGHLEKRSIAREAPRPR